MSNENNTTQIQADLMNAMMQSAKRSSIDDSISLAQA